MSAFSTLFVMPYCLFWLLLAIPAVVGIRSVLLSGTAQQRERIKEQKDRMREFRIGRICYPWSLSKRKDADLIEWLARIPTVREYPEYLIRKALGEDVEDPALLGEIFYGRSFLEEEYGFRMSRPDVIRFYRDHKGYATGKDMLKALIRKDMAEHEAMIASEAA